MKILLLGKTGFVGRNLFEHFESSEGFEIEAPTHGELDVLDEGAVFVRLREGSYDAVLNCLDRHAFADASYAEERLRMFHNLAHHRDLYGKMVYFGSGAEYGRQFPLESVGEDDFGRVIPTDSYGFALYQMAEFSLMSENIYDLRLLGIFGKYELWDRRFISNCICKALCGFPLTIRQDRVMDYLDVADLCLMVDWVLQGDPEHHAYNATSGKRYALSKLADEVLDRVGVDVPVFIAKEGLAPEYTSGNDLIVREMGGFEPTPIARSIEALIAFYRDHVEHIDRERLLYQ